MRLLSRKWLGRSCVLGVLVLVTVALPSCARGGMSPSPPASSGPFLGTWSGTISSDVIGAGRVTVVMDSQIGDAAFPLLSGTWVLSFSEARFNTHGPLVANLNPEKTILGITFDRNTVPCPSAPGGTAERTLFVSMAVSGDRMRGPYIAGGCPGGSMDLVRK